MFGKARSSVFQHLVHLLAPAGRHVTLQKVCLAYAQPQRVFHVELGVPFSQMTGMCIVCVLLFKINAFESTLIRNVPSSFCMVSMSFCNEIIVASVKDVLVFSGLGSERSPLERASILSVTAVEMLFWSNR